MTRFIGVAVFLYLFIGGCDIDCGKGPTQIYDLNSASISSDIFDGENWIQNVDEAPFEDLRLFLEIEFERIASLNFRSNSLYALDCTDPTLISNEIAKVELITNHDINETYLAGDNVNAIALSNGGYSLLEEILLVGDTYMLTSNEILIEEVPDVGSKFSITLIITLMDGSQITAISNDVLII